MQYECFWAYRKIKMQQVIFFVSSGLGGMSGAQAKAVEIAGGV